MAITRTTMIDDDGTGTTGTIINNAWKQEFYGQIDTFVGGNGIAIPYSASYYTAATGTWTVAAGNQITLAYAIVGNLAFFSLLIQNSNNSAATGTLLITLPGTTPVPTAKIVTPLIYYANAGGTGYIDLPVFSRTLTLLRDAAGTPWPATANSLLVAAQWFFPIA